jgi:hypothetical protein
MESMAFWYGVLIGVLVGSLLMALLASWSLRRRRARAAFERFGYAEANADTLRILRDGWPPGADGRTDETGYPDTVVSDASALLSRPRDAP